MSKRAAETERVGYEDEFQSTAPSGEPSTQKATAAQLAQRKMAKPRGSRRPGAQARPLTPQASPLSQSFPAPSWGTNNSSASASIQQPSGSFTFGQQSGGFSSVSNPTASTSPFPNFGDQSANSVQNFTAPSSTGFNFAAPPPTGNNPFASLSQNSNSTTVPGGFSGNIFNLQPQNAAAPKSPNKEGDSSKLFAPNAPFSWGKPDPPSQEQAQQAGADSHAHAANPQSSTSSIFSQANQQSPSPNDLFAHLQQPSPLSSNPFAQQPAQQAQAPTVFGQQVASPFQSQPSQSTPSPFGQPSTSQNPASSNIFGKPATSPAKDGDRMSTTPDTSPQASNDRARLGPFASLNDSTTKPITNGVTPAGPGSGVFGSPFQASSDQEANPPNGEAVGGMTANEGSQRSEKHAAEISLGSPTKRNRNTTHPGSDPPHADEQASSKNNPFASITFPAPNPSTAASPLLFPSTPLSGQKLSSHGSQANGHTSSLFPRPNAESRPAQDSQPPRQPGAPPEAPADFTEEQRRQLITGWRLKSLDQGLRTYLQYSTGGKMEVESIKRFYTLQKDAILEANGDPIPENGKKRVTEDDQPYNSLLSKRARSERSSDTAKADNQIRWPSLPPTEGSQTSKMFGNLVGKKSKEDSSEIGKPAVNGRGPNEITSTEPAPRLEQNSSPFANVSNGTTSSVNLSGSSAFSGSNKQSPFSFGQGGASLLSQSQSQTEKTNNQSQPPPIRSNSPFKGFISGAPKSSNVNAPSGGFFQSQIKSGNGATTASAESNAAAEGGGNARSSNTSSIFSEFYSGDSDSAAAKRKVDESRKDDSDTDGANMQGSEEQPSKKPRAGASWAGTLGAEKQNSTISRDSATTERQGHGESIFARSGTPPASSTNLFGHLTQSSNEPRDDRSDDNEKGEDGQEEENEKRISQMNASSKTNQTREGSNISRSVSPLVYNPFASATFPVPTLKSAEAGKSASTSLFDRIQKDDQGQLVKDSNTVNFGQSILKTPAGQKSVNTFDQPKTSGTNPFGMTNINSGSSIFGSNSSFASKETPFKASTSNMFGTSSASNNAPVANMSASQETSGSPGGDNTWKPETPIKFGNTTNAAAPSINFTSPSPARTPLTGLFGAPKPSTTFESSSPFGFKTADSASAKPASLTFGISAPVKESNDTLAPPSGTQSESTSRATSPGGTDNEGGGGEPSDAPHDEETSPQINSADASKAEADEDVMFEVKAKLLKYDNSHADKANHKWVLQGTDELRILKHRETNKTRMLMRLRNGRIILNAGLQKNLKYILAAAKQVRVPVPANGKVESWTVQVGKEDDAKKLVGLLEENKVY